MKKSIGKMAISLVLFLCFVLWGSISGAVVAEAKYTVTSLGTLGGGTYSKSYDINDSGWIVGEGDFSSASGIGIRGFLWKKETGMINLGALGTKSLARGINNAGKVVGYTQPPSAAQFAFTWTDAEGMKELPFSGPDSDGWAINDSDAIAGYGKNGNGQERGFRWAGALEIDLEHWAEM